MLNVDVDTPAAWTADDLRNDKNWVFRIDDAARAQVARAVKGAYVPEKRLFDYTRDDFDLGPAWDTIRAAFAAAHAGRGIALVKGLPRDGISEAEFELMNWAVGLHVGVARPQGIKSQYISAVRNTGFTYRAANGRGYSSNAKLDFHVDTADFVSLACYNKAKSGGQSMITSSLMARRILIAERPDLAEIAHRDFYFSRNMEEAPDEAPTYPQPLFDIADGRVFAKWNRNRVRTAQEVAGVPKLTAKQTEAIDALDEILCRPELMYTMYLEPGDLQILNNHVMLHSRTDFVDHDEPERKRLLSRLWLAPPNSVLLPETWRHSFRAIQPGSVRGGIRGHCHDDACRAWERRQASSHGMSAA